MADAIKKMLLYFGSLLEGEVRLEYAQLLLKMMVINIYSIHHAADTHGGGCGLIRVTMFPRMIYSEQLFVV